MKAEQKLIYIYVMMMMMMMMMIIIIIIMCAQNKDVKLLQSVLLRRRIIYLSYFVFKFGNPEDYLICGIYGILLFLYF
jgi:hypothetical protein